MLNNRIINILLLEKKWLGLIIMILINLKVFSMYKRIDEFLKRVWFFHLTIKSLF